MSEASTLHDKMCSSTRCSIAQKRNFDRTDRDISHGSKRKQRMLMMEGWDRVQVIQNRQRRVEHGQKIGINTTVYGHFDEVVHQCEVVAVIQRGL